MSECLELEPRDRKVREEERSDAGRVPREERVGLVPRSLPVSAEQVQVEPRTVEPDAREVRVALVVAELLLELEVSERPFGDDPDVERRRNLVPQAAATARGGPIVEPNPDFLDRRALDLLEVRIRIRALAEERQSRGQFDRRPWP